MGEETIAGVVARIDALLAAHTEAVLEDEAYALNDDWPLGWVRG